MGRSSVLVGLLVVGLLAAPAASSASEAKPTQEAPCKADVERHCASAATEKGARGRCLRKHRSELSPACRQHIESRPRRSGDAKRIGSLAGACGADLEQHCPDAELHGAQVRCLRAHTDALSAKCSERMTKKKRERKKPQPES